MRPVSTNHEEFEFFQFLAFSHVRACWRFGIKNRDEQIVCKLLWYYYIVRVRTYLSVFSNLVV